MAQRASFCTARTVSTSLRAQICSWNSALRLRQRPAGSSPPVATPVFLELKGGHWLSLYGGLWPEGTLPPLEMRTMTADLPDVSVLSDDVPNAKSQTLPFFVKLMGAWIAMGFRSPKVPVEGEIHV